MQTRRATTWWPPLTPRLARLLRLLAVGYAVVLALGWIGWTWYDLFADAPPVGASLGGVHLMVLGLPWTLVTVPLTSPLPSVVSATVVAVGSWLLDVVCTRMILAASWSRRPEPR